MFCIYVYSVKSLSCLSNKTDELLFQVSNSAQEIMLHLLQSQLLLPEELWAKLLDCLTCILPVLQVSYSI
jgi:predicted component of type VI protein secretion system